MDIREIIHQARAHLQLLQASGVREWAIAEPEGRRPSGSAPTNGGTGNGSREKGEQMEAFRARIADCRKCKLSEGRTQVVFGTGNPDSPLVFVGEAPGEEEDRQGYPFVGRAGQLLTKMIEAMGLKREEIYIANVIKCRPPKNRNPEEDEITSCQPFLWEQIRIIQPRIICALGKFAAQTLLKTEVPISQLRGKIGRLSPDAASGIPSGLLERLMVVPTFHPAYLLRNPSAKSATWKDLQLIMTELGITTPLKTKEEVRS